jgi:hypothetical protein
MVKIEAGDPMKQRIFYTISILIILSLSACGSAEPTLNPADQASTALAEAWIFITQTQAALPTSTPIPFTATPEPTLTFLPTIPILVTIPPAATVASAPTQDQCNQPPPAKPQGALVNVDFANQSDGQVSLALGMNTPNDKKECVTYSFSLGSSSGLVDAKILAGCYWGYAWITGKEPSVARTGSLILCMTDTSGTYHIVITKESINFKGQ